MTKKKKKDKNTRDQAWQRLEFVSKDPLDNPCCPHGPSLLFEKEVKGKSKRFYVCAARRKRKFCPFYLKEGGTPKTGNFWEQMSVEFYKGIDHGKMIQIADEVKQLQPCERTFCSTCCSFVLKNIVQQHENHDLITGFTDEQILNPTKILPPSENVKSDAQYWFSATAVECIVQILKSQNYKNVICIGAPRIHEHVRNHCKELTSILLDFDKRFHNFFGVGEFCWYNLFNNHFFFDQAKEIFFEFLKSNGGNDMVIITDPPFGGRTEPILLTLKSLNQKYQELNGRTDNIPMFWIYPYFLEHHIIQHDPNFVMLDYKVEYDNHAAFGEGPKARKLGSPVRIFTTVSPSLIKLPEEGYEYCEKCDRWVLNENNHCDLCKSCTSKDGSTYVHCKECKRCVKPTWNHCIICKKCRGATHKCNVKLNEQACIYCNSFNHKKRKCPIRKRAHKNIKKKAKKRKATESTSDNDIENKRIRKEVTSEETELNEDRRNEDSN